jgi:hypothetical protein
VTDRPGAPRAAAVAIWDSGRNKRGRTAQRYLASTGTSPSREPLEIPQPPSVVRLVKVPDTRLAARKHSSEARVLVLSGGQVGDKK